MAALLCAKDLCKTYVIDKRQNNVLKNVNLEVKEGEMVAIMQIVKDYRDNKVLSAREKLRYSEIRREMYNITDAVLAATLKDLTESVWVIVKPKV